MNLIKIFLSATLLMMAFSMSGCQGNNSDSPENNSSAPDINNTLPPIDVNATKDPVTLSFVFSDEMNVTSSGEQRAVYIRAFDASGTLNTEGTITVQYPQKSDAGQFSPNTATIVDGIAQFTYTAPLDLQGRVDAGDTFSEYTFFSTTNGTVNATLHVNYTPGSSIVIGEPILSQLTLSESTINITQSEETKTLTLFAYTDQSTTNIDLSVGIQYGNTGLDVGYFSPSSPSIVDGRVTFTYNGPLNLLTTSGSLATTTFTLYDRANPGITAPLVVNFVPNVPVIRVESPTVTLTQNSQAETVTVLAFDSITNKAFESGTILVEYPTAITNGSVSGGTFTQNEATIVNGKAVFSFNGPNPLSTIANQTFVFKYKENQTVSTNLVMQYTPDLPQIASLAINEATTAFTQNSQVHTVIINALDSNGDFVNSGTINVKFPAEISNGTDLGTFTSFSIAVTNGQATFSYTGPTDLVATSVATGSEIFIFTDAANNTNTVNWTTNFTPDTPTLRVESPTVILTGNSQAESVTILAFDSNNKAFTGGNIVIEYPTAITNGSVSGGTFTQAEAIIENGKATFNFVGPNPLAQIANQVFTFKYKENQSVEANLTMQYNPVLPSIATLAINEASTTISQDKQIHSVVINAIDTNGDFVATGTINVKFPTAISNGTDVGSFTELSVAVVNGQATFEYSGPTNVLETSLVLANGVFEFSDAAGIASSVSWTVTYDPEVPVIRFANSLIELTQNSQTVIVHVLGFDENNQSLHTGTISVAYPTEIVNQNANGGRFLENEAQISDGEALFTFSGPSNLEDIDDLVFTFSYKGNALVATKDLTVKYNPPVPLLILSKTTEEVTLNSQTVNIEVDVRDGNNTNPYPSGSVIVNYSLSKTDIKNGRDIGSFISSEVALVNGVASFVYTAPKNLAENNDSISFSFYHDSVGPSEDNNFTVTIDPEDGQVILTDYFLTTSYADGNITMDLEGTKLITFYIKDKDDNLLGDSNITIMDVSILNTILADLSDTNATAVPADNKQLYKNSSSLSILSNTVSGVVPIKVVATFKGVNNENIVLTEVFNVVIVSGPPTAMSISYVSTENDADNSKFIDKMIVSLTDKYSNRVDNNPGLSVALIAGYTSDSSGPLGYMYHPSGATVDTADDKIKVPSGTVMKASVTNSGSNYSVAPIVGTNANMNTGGLASGFAATAYLSSFGGVSSVDLITGGKEYVTPPVVVAEGSGSGFSATAVLATTGTFFTTETSDTTGLPIINLDNQGSGYTLAPSVSVTTVPGGASGFDAVAILEEQGSISGFTINDGGLTYAVGDVLVVTGDCSSASSPSLKVSAISGGGATGPITDITIFNSGTACTYSNVDTLADGKGDADITLSIGFSIKEIQLRNGGTGYDDEDITVAPPVSGTTALASSKIGYGVASVTVDAIGSGYRSASITFTNEEDGEGAFASSTIKYPVSNIEITNNGTGYNDGTLTLTRVDAPTVLDVEATATGTVFADFSTVVENTGTNDEFLMTFGDGYSYNASGKWDITSTGTNNEFERVLLDQYEGITTSGLGFAIGNNFRQDVCIDGKEWVATATTPVAEFDSNGLAEVDITYDYYLVAKDVILSANLVGAQNSVGEIVKIGEATKHTLRGSKVVADVLNIPAGLNHAVYRIYVDLDGLPIGNLRNANFTYTVSTTSLGLTIHRVSDSMDDGIHACPSTNDRARAYVEVEVSTTLTSTITLENLAISREFK